MVKLILNKNAFFHQFTTGNLQALKLELLLNGISPWFTRIEKRANWRILVVLMYYNKQGSLVGKDLYMRGTNLQLLLTQRNIWQVVVRICLVLFTTTFDSILTKFPLGVRSFKQLDTLTHSASFSKITAPYCKKLHIFNQYRYKKCVLDKNDKHSDHKRCLIRTREIGLIFHE